MAIAVLVFVLVVTPAFGAVLSMYHMTANDTFRATVSATTGGYEPEKVKYIQQILEKRPDDQTVRFLLASQLKDGGYFLQAFEHYKKLLDIQSDNYRAFNNMGNIYFATQQFGQGINYYRRATEVEPNFALAYFNTYLAQKEQFHFTEAEASLIRARNLDAEAVARYLEFSENEGSVTPVDARIEMSEVWVQLARESSASPLLYPGSFITTAGFLNPLSVAGLIALALSFGLNSLLRGPPACCCGRCGRAYCRDCEGEPGPVGLCPQCVDVADGLQGSPEARSRKFRQVVRYQGASRLGRRLLSVVLPGAGHLLADKTLRGFVILLGWFFLCLHLVLDRALLSFPGYATAVGGVPMLLIGLLATVWLLGNLVRFPAFR
jgi:tetratricopeptide (TPR) repeat protein